jgi:uncharacterized protein YeaO (DUF488 family)
LPISTSGAARSPGRLHCGGGTGTFRTGFPEFRQRYRTELSTGDAAEAVQCLRRLARERTLTLLTASRDSATSNATVLAEVLSCRL